MQGSACLDVCGLFCLAFVLAVYWCVVLAEQQHCCVCVLVMVAEVEAGVDLDVGVIRCGYARQVLVYSSTAVPGCIRKACLSVLIFSVLG